MQGTTDMIMVCFLILNCTCWISNTIPNDINQNFNNNSLICVEIMIIGNNYTLWALILMSGSHPTSLLSGA